ncbi:MAG: hypothetical protein HC912_03095 [Saprospiraceae bacterium]|nr:hypothetical protein [Saprospiraceae bacterium]
MKITKPKSYSDFTLDHLQEIFGIKTQYEEFSLQAQPFAVPDWLPELFDATKGLPNATEKAKSEFYITPILTAFFQANNHKFQYFSGYTFDVDKQKALRGRCDYLLTKSQTLNIDVPVFAIFEAKDDSLNHWYGQCGAEMYAAQLFNAKKGKPIHIIYGAVSNGLTWQFLRLTDLLLEVDTRLYTIENHEVLLGTLQTIINFYD